MSDSQRTIAVLRAIALLGALPFAASCAEAHAQAPRGGARDFAVRVCPSALPTSGARCAAVESSTLPHTCRFGATRCLCYGRSVRDARWACERAEIMRGPLPPPELAADA